MCRRKIKILVALPVFIYDRLLIAVSVFIGGAVLRDYTDLRDIPCFSEWKEIEPVDKGWSGDIKYKITDKSGNRYLLRIAEPEEYDRKKFEFEMISIISKLDILLPKPVETGVFGCERKVYSLQTWVDGEDAADILPGISEESQYEFGVKAGKALKKLHSIKVPDVNESWSQFYSRKIRRKIENYRNCRIEIPNGDKIIKYIEDNISCLEGRPQTFQHGDYHAGNLVITPDNEIGVIDFDRFDFGDPWEEYGRFVFTWQVSIPFAIGHIHGYFNNNVPDRFFKLMALYNASSIIASAPCSIPHGDEGASRLLMNAEQIYDAYCGFEEYIPLWYREPAKYNKKNIQPSFLSFHE